MNKGADGTARVRRLVLVFNEVEVHAALKILQDLVKKANFDNLKVYTVFKYIATLWAYNHKFRHALSSLRSFHAYMSS